MLWNNNPGRLLVIEGLDGSGKATQSELLARAMEQRSAGSENFLPRLRPQILHSGADVSGRRDRQPG